MAEEKKSTLLNEEAIAEQSETSVEGPNVTAKKKIKKNYSDLLWILLGAAVILSFAVIYYYQAVADLGKRPEKDADASSYTSKRKLHLSSLTAEIPPVRLDSEPQNLQESAAPEPKVEPQPEKKPDLPLVPVVQAPTVQQVLVTPATTENAVKQEPELSLTDRRNQAPMMGEPKGQSNKNSATQDPRYDIEPAPLNKLDNLLRASQTPAATAEIMPDRNLLLAKGTFIDCILETKIDTTVPGMTACVIPQNIYSANGKVLLIEKGSRAVGEYKSAVENGLNRIFVLWTQIQTPKGVRVSLDSPTTDALGGAGMSGEVDFHWWKRFGNALLFSLVQDGFEFSMNQTTDKNGGVNYYQNSQDGMNEIIKEAMRQSGNIPPTLTKNQGEKIGIFTARDVDFSKVYQLVPTSTTAP